MARESAKQTTPAVIVVSAYGLKKESPATYRIKALLKGFEEANLICHLITVDPCEPKDQIEAEYSSWESLQPNMVQKLIKWLLELIKNEKEKKGSAVKTAYNPSNLYVALYGFFFTYRYPVPFLRIYNRAARKIRRLIEDGLKPLLIISSSPGILHIIGYLLKAKFGKDIIWIADFQDPLENDPILETPENFIFRKTDDLVFKKADWITSPSSEVLRIISETATRRGFNVKEKMLLLPFGVIDIKKSSEKAITSKEKTILYGGTLYLERTKGFQALLDALKELQNYTVIYAGFTPELATSLLENSSLTKGRYRVYGLLEKEKYEKLIRSSSILLVLGTSKSKYRVIGSKVFELLSYNKPILIIAEKNSDYYRTLKSLKGVYWSEPEPSQVLKTLQRIEEEIFVEEFQRTKEDLKSVLAVSVARDFLRKVWVQENA